MRPFRVEPMGEPAQSCHCRRDGKAGRRKSRILESAFGCPMRRAGGEGERNAQAHDDRAYNRTHSDRRRIEGFFRGRRFLARRMLPRLRFARDAGAAGMAVTLLTSLAFDALTAGCGCSACRAPMSYGRCAICAFLLLGFVLHKLVKDMCQLGVGRRDDVLLGRRFRRLALGALRPVSSAFRLFECGAVWGPLSASSLAALSGPSTLNVVRKWLASRRAACTVSGEWSPSLKYFVMTYSSRMARAFCFRFSSLPSMSLRARILSAVSCANAV